jgi:polyisoprenoid-binding protein YceI
MRRTFIASALLLSLPLLAQAEPVTYTLDPTHTTVLWEAKHFGTSLNHGRFDRESGSVTLDLAAKTGKAEVSIDISSISTGTENFDKHLKAADFFDVANHPTATFVGDQFSFEGDQVKSVSGTLTMLGVSAPVTLTAMGFNCYDNPYSKKQACGGDFETTIKRSDWGMKYGLPGIPDEVKLRIQVEGGRQ